MYGHDAVRMAAIRLVLLGVKQRDAAACLFWESAGVLFVKRCAISVAIAFLIVSIFVTSLLGGQLHGGADQPCNSCCRMEDLNWPSGWRSLLQRVFAKRRSFRGYLQRQFMALPEKLPSLASCFQRDVQDGLTRTKGFARRLTSAWARCIGFRALAQSVRPGMIAHTLLLDVLGGLFAGSIKR